MSLGGYKFAGRFCNKGSLTDAQWARCMHATKVAAFMAANTAANAGWDYDMEGSTDGNIHALDTVGNNYVTCFKNTEDSSYFAIYTLTCFGTSADAGTGRIKVYLTKNTLGTATGHDVGTYASNFYRLSKSHIAYDADLSSPAEGITDLFPVGNMGAQAMSADTAYGKTNTLFSSSKNYYGYAIKAQHIVMFAGDARTASGLSISVASTDAFASLFNANDHRKECCINLQPRPSDLADWYEANARNTNNNYTAFAGVILALNRSGVCTNGARLIAAALALYNGNMQEYPYQNIMAAGVENDGTNVPSKGALNVDLLAVNMQSVSGDIVPSLLSPVANGAYLTISANTMANGDANFFKYSLLNDLGDQATPAVWLTAYVGWDSSNPDITTDSAWSEYTE